MQKKGIRKDECLTIICVKKSVDLKAFVFEKWMNLWIVLIHCEIWHIWGHLKEGKVIVRKLMMRKAWSTKRCKNKETFKFQMPLNVYENPMKTSLAGSSTVDPCFPNSTPRTCHPRVPSIPHTHPWVPVPMIRLVICATFEWIWVFFASLTVIVFLLACSNPSPPSSEIPSMQISFPHLLILIKSKDLIKTFSLLFEKFKRVFTNRCRSFENSLKRLSVNLPIIVNARTPRDRRHDNVIGAPRVEMQPPP